MKKLLKYFIAISSVFLLTQCEGFLDKEPLGNIATEDFYLYANDLQLAVNAVYEVCSRKAYQKSEWLFGDGTSDDLTSTYEVSPSSEIGKIIHFTFSNDDPLILERWRVNYIGINKANWVINQAPQMYARFNDFDIAENKVLQEAKAFRRMIGQAKFLRAVFYFNLVKSFGGVPIMPEHLYLDESGHNFIQPRATVDEVYDYIEKDLREAVLILEGDYSFGTNPEDKGRVTKGAAMALLTKVLAYQAEAGVSGGHPKWQQALRFAGHMIDGTPTQIAIGELLDYENLYSNQSIWEVLAKLAINSEDVDSTITTENIFNIAYDKLLPNEKTVINKYTLFDYEKLWSSIFEYNAESIFEINLIDNKQYSSHGSFLLDFNANNKLQAAPFLYDQRLEDPRLVVAIAGKGEKVTDIQSVNPLIEPMQCLIFKWFAVNEERSVYGENSKNFKIMRFAEVILFYAEALNECGNQTQAITQLNKLRERANSINESDFPRSGDPISAFAVSDYIKTRDLIREQRRLELCFEHDRFWDIVRQGTATENMRLFNSSMAKFGARFTKNFTPIVNEIFPIPQEEIDLSNGVLTQNPGY